MMSKNHSMLDKRNLLSNTNNCIQRSPFFSAQQNNSDHFFSRSNDPSAAHIDGPPNPQAAATTPCPSSVSIGSLRHYNHSDLPQSEQEKWGTYLEVTSTMDVGPGPDHTGHCMKEKLTTVSNTCPAQVYSRGGPADSSPCTGNRCLDVNRFGSGPTAFIDMHRTKAPASLLAGSGVNACKVVCEQTYSCDRKFPTRGKFLITRNFRADTITKNDGTKMDITTGDVQKEVADPIGDFEITDEIRHTA